MTHFRKALLTGCLHWSLSTRKISHAETTTQITYDALLMEIPGDRDRERRCAPHPTIRN